MEADELMKIRKVVIPAAGRGTRFLPATKVLPKEMLPIVDKPVVQYVVEEAVEAGFEDIIFITGQGKSTIEDHFDYSLQLESTLKEQGKEELLKIIQDLSSLTHTSSIRQKQPLGLGHAVLIAEPFVGQEAFGVLLGDDVIHSDIPCMSQLLEVYAAHRCSVLAILELPRQDLPRYGVPAVEPVSGTGGNQWFRVTDLIEKPAPEEAPSNLAIVGRYILTPRIFDALRETPPGAQGEIQLTDGLRRLLEEEPIYACRFQGTRYDAGNKLEYLVANVEFALQRPDLGERVREYLARLCLHDG